jgi:hypothetical protein
MTTPAPGTATRGFAPQDEEHDDDDKDPTDP